jgi:hypothetical protein
MILWQLFWSGTINKQQLVTRLYADKRKSQRWDIKQLENNQKLKRLLELNTKHAEYFYRLVFAIKRPVRFVAIPKLSARHAPLTYIIGSKPAKRRVDAHICSDIYSQTSYVIFCHIVKSFVVTWRAEIILSSFSIPIDKNVYIFKCHFEEILTNHSTIYWVSAKCT